jgi:hypothetical protein
MRIGEEGKDAEDGQGTFAESRDQGGSGTHQFVDAGESGYDVACGLPFGHSGG